MANTFGQTNGVWLGKLEWCKKNARLIVKSVKSRCPKKSCAAARRQHVMGQGAWRLEADAGVVSGLPDSARCAD